MISDMEVYAAYYGEGDKLLTVTVSPLDKLPISFGKTYSYDTHYSNVVKIKAFVWKSGTLKPLSNVIELDITEQ